MSRFPQMECYFAKCQRIEADTCDHYFHRDIRAADESSAGHSWMASVDLGCTVLPLSLLCLMPSTTSGVRKAFKIISIMKHGWKCLKTKITGSWSTVCLWFTGTVHGIALNQNKSHHQAFFTRQGHSHQDSVASVSVTRRPQLMQWFKLRPCSSFANRNCGWESVLSDQPTIIVAKMRNLLSLDVWSSQRRPTVHLQLQTLSNSSRLISRHQKR